MFEIKSVGNNNKNNFHIYYIFYKRIGSQRINDIVSPALYKAMQRGVTSRYQLSRNLR